MPSFDIEHERLRKLAVEKGLISDEGTPSAQDMQELRAELAASGVTEEGFLETFAALIEGDGSGTYIIDLGDFD